GARGVLINITGGMDMTLFEVDEAANRVREEVDPEANIIVGSTMDESMEGQMRVSVVATGIDAGDQPAYAASQEAVQPQPQQQTAAPTFRLRPQGQPAPSADPNVARATSPEIKAASPDGGFSPDHAGNVQQQPSMSHAAGMTRSTPGLNRPQAQASGEFIASGRRPSTGFSPQRSPAPSAVTPGDDSDWSQTRAPQRDLARPPSLFERVTQSFARQRQEHVEPQPEPAMAGAEPERKPAAATQGDDIYDIPTFLRR
ncbi:MAG: hypothetical protein ACRBM6_07070, partial [Geminicoccales bacterium]